MPLRILQSGHPGWHLAFYFKDLSQLKNGVEDGLEARVRELASGFDSTRQLVKISYQ
jgi:hypothetical protein